MEQRLELRTVFLLASQEKPVKMVLLEEIERQLGGPLEVIVEMGVDVPFDALGFVALPAAFAHSAGNVAGEPVHQADLAHDDAVPARLLPLENEGADRMEFVQDHGEGPHVRSPFENQMVARRPGQGEILPETGPAAGESGQPRAARGQDRLAGEGADFFEVVREGVLVGLGEVQRFEVPPGFAQEVLQRQSDLFPGLPPLVGVQKERADPEIAGLKVREGLDLTSRGELHAVSFLERFSDARTKSGLELALAVSPSREPG